MTQTRLGRRIALCVLPLAAFHLVSISACRPISTRPPISDSLSLAGVVATALASQLDPTKGQLRRLTVRSDQGWLKIVADSIAARYSEFLVTGKDTVGAVQIGVDRYSVVSDTVLVHLFVSQCDVHSYWISDVEFLFIAHPTWRFIETRNGGVTDGAC
jgi:hypothetical protein